MMNELKRANQRVRGLLPLPIITAAAVIIYAEFNSRIPALRGLCCRWKREHEGEQPHANDARRHRRRHDSARSQPGALSVAECFELLAAPYLNFKSTTLLQRIVIRT
jgi:hypothetical protein